MVNPSFHLKEDRVIIMCGEKSLELRACTGETGENGPFPCINLIDKGGGRVTSIHSEALFDKMFSFLDDL